MSATCGVCRFAAAITGPDGQVVFGVRVCRRYPPRPLVLPNVQQGRPQIGIQNHYPTVDASEWCGEFGPKPEDLQ